jgi:phosphatidyl-myo-inositol dimannoside synthase
MILGVFTETFGNGGIQRVARHTCAALAWLSNDQHQRYKFFSLNDPVGIWGHKVGEIEFSLQGFGRQKVRFALSILASARKTKVAILGHPNFAAFGLVFNAARPRVRYSVITYGTDIWARLPRLSSYGFHAADKIAALTKFTACQIASLHKIEPSKIICLPPALDPVFGAGKASRRLSLLPDYAAPILLTVARLARTEYKGVDKVIEALPSVLAAEPRTLYVVVGQGDDLPRLQQLASEVGVAEHVLFAGNATDDELPQYYAACDVYVMPSRLEGFGIAFLEAMALGKPVIGGRHGGTPDLLDEGVTGFLVDHSDVKTLTDRIIALLGNETLRLRMGEAARKCVAQNYTFEHFRQRLLSMLSISQAEP